MEQKSKLIIYISILLGTIGIIFLVIYRIRSVRFLKGNDEDVVYLWLDDKEINKKNKCRFSKKAM